jgi:hypothetical protein
MKSIFVAILFLFTAINVCPVYGQQSDEAAARDQIRSQLGKLLEREGPTVNVAFSQSKRQPYNYVGSLNMGLANAKSLEIVISVTPKNTIGFRVYPHYNKGYINIDRVADRAALMRLLLRLSDRAFFFWGADESGDIFTGYTFTLESGFPEEAITVVLRSIVNSDKFVGELRPILDAPIPTVNPVTPSVVTPAKSTPKKTAPSRSRRRGR